MYLTDNSQSSPPNVVGIADAEPRPGCLSHVLAHLVAIVLHLPAVTASPPEQNTRAQILANYPFAALVIAVVTSRRRRRRRCCYW